MLCLLTMAPLLIRQILHKIKSINNFLEESFLRDLGIIKKSLVVKAIKSNKPTKYIKGNAGTLSKQYIGKIEHTVYELMHRIIFFDKKLLKKYKKGEVRIIGKEKLGIKDLENTLKIESELLEALEAKIPPSSLIKKKLFKTSLPYFHLMKKQRRTLACLIFLRLNLQILFH